jgi:hypothetical protein
MKTIIKLLAVLVLTLSTLASTAQTVLAAAPQIQTFHHEGSFEIGPCPSSVTLLATGTEDVRLITFFNETGDPISIQVHVNYEAVVTNPETGQTVKDHAHATVFIDPIEGTRGNVGLYYSTTVPGLGVVFHDVGWLVRDIETGTILFEAGPHNVLHGDEVALFCTALGA